MYRPPRVSRLRHQRRKQGIVRATLFLLLFISIAVAAVYFSYHPIFSIQSINVEGDTMAAAAVTALLEEPLEEKLFYLFPKRNIFLYPVDRMEALVLDTFPMLSSVHIDREGKVLAVTTEERIPFGVFCPEDAEAEPGAECFVLDKDGYIFATEASITISTGTGSLPRFEKKTTTLSPLKTTFLPVSIFEKLKEILATLFAAGFAPVLVVVEEAGDYRITFKDGGTVLLSPDRDPTLAVEALDLLLKSDEFTKKGYSLNTVEYVDLRFGGKIYYKPR